MLKIQQTNHHFQLNITINKSTSLYLRKIGLQFKTLSSFFFAKQQFLFFVIKLKPFEVILKQAKIDG